MIQNKKVTICACASRSFVNKDKVAEIAAILRNEEYSVTVIPDLCEKVMQASPEITEIASSLIIACYPRAIRSHLHRLNLVAANILDIRNSDCDEILGQLQIKPCSDKENLFGKESTRKEIDGFPVENGTDAWYPVIDKERCSECGRCRDFCLFGVYTSENRQIKVAQPQNCKNNCPACARMCPSKAIIFPKYEKSPVNGGLDEEEHFAPEEMDAMYRERLKMRLAHRKAGVSLLKNQ
ncbi:ATP-binding protein [Macellibacteroides fermentans]|uniref:ATP-binding protein n=1 Tax=Macellibacteroides fermentans TaxID=879969 RepID=UPI00406C9955